MATATVRASANLPTLLAGVKSLGYEARTHGRFFNSKIGKYGCPQLEPNTTYQIAPGPFDSDARVSNCCSLWFKRAGVMPESFRIFEADLAYCA